MAGRTVRRTAEQESLFIILPLLQTPKRSTDNFPVKTRMTPRRTGESIRSYLPNHVNLGGERDVGFRMSDFGSFAVCFQNLQSSADHPKSDILFVTPGAVRLYVQGWRSLPVR